MPKPVEAVSAEQGERCQLCGSLVEVVFSDEGTSCYRPASTEQGDVEVIREARHMADRKDHVSAEASKIIIAALDQLAAAIEEGTPGVMHSVDKAFYDLTVKQRDSAWAALERAERERDDWKRSAADVSKHELIAVRRAEKAERALTETQRYCELQIAMEHAGDDPSGVWIRNLESIIDILRPSEDVMATTEIPEVDVQRAAELARERGWKNIPVVGDES